MGLERLCAGVIVMLVLGIVPSTALAASSRTLVVVGGLVVAIAVVFVGALVGLILLRRSFGERITRLRQKNDRDRSAAESALARAEARFRSVFQGAPLGICVVDVDGTMRETNAALDAMLGYHRGELIGKRIETISDPIDRHAIMESFTALIRGEVRSYEHERRYRRSDGASIWAHVNVTTVVDHENPFAIMIINDVSERILTQDRLIYEATHDALTDLPNRALFTAQLAEALRKHPPGLAVAFVDLDHFKIVNDSLGHQAGDELLRVIADRLRSSIRPGEMVARLGGDEFGVIFFDSDLVPRVKSLLARIAEPADFSERRLYTSASIGVALALEQYERAEDLLRDADIALYRSKAAGRATYTFFDEVMHQRAVRHLQISSDVREAAASPDQFAVAYQPIVRLGDEQIAGFEALVRWNHPTEGLLLPDQFIPAAEENGVIIALGREVLYRATRRLALEQQRLPNATMHVNVSVAEIMHGDLIEHVFRALESARVRPEHLTLEITEHTILDASTGAGAILERLLAGGVRITVDDFGIGYSSLRYLRTFPISGLKIDRSFVSGSGSGLASEPIVQMILDLGRSLNLSVVAEGIECRPQAQRLNELGCLYGQGFFFGEPLLETPQTPLVFLTDLRYSG